MTQAEHPVSMKQYIAVGVALAVLLLLGVMLSQFPISRSTAAVLVLSLAAIKAALVAMYYMHLKSDRRWLSYVAAFPLMIVALAVLLVLSSRLVHMGGAGEHPEAHRTL
jgi:cytochrome c oxidase subunit 4